VAETLLLGLEGITRHFSYGPVSRQDVEDALAMAARHGFTLGDLRYKE
jgi:predicted amino acid dehydrogenase